MSLMRELSVTEITKNIREMCIEANYYLEPDVKAAIQAARLSENSDVGRSVLEQLDINMEIAENERKTLLKKARETAAQNDGGDML